MQPFEYFPLSIELSHIYGLGTAPAHLLSATVILACLIRLCDRYGRQPKSDAEFSAMDQRALRDYRSACHDFDREVQAWEKAARQKGGCL